ncbi:MAG: HNH endonuclease [Gammaproteobacteria bacterium]|nr:HNH endonuclease [Gammaproteobacteria bacterium]
MKYLGYTRIKKASHKDWLLNSTSSKKGNVDELKDIEGKLIDVYKHYDGIVKKHSKKIGKSQFKKSSGVLKDFYNKPPASLKKELLKRRNEHGLSECPFCGNPVSPNTLDHFIPKNDWPEFSIFPNNLVPQCRDCAPIKGDDYFDDTEKLAIFHSPMYHKALSEVTFSIAIDFDQTTKSISVTPKFWLTDDINSCAVSVKRLTLHFRGLQVKKRIITYSNRMLRHWKSLLRENDFDISDALQTRINERTSDDQDKNWETALYKGILKNQDLVNYLESLTPTGKTHVQKPKAQIHELEL